MKKIVLAPMLMAFAGWCAAQEAGRVISSTPIYQPVAVPRQVCATEPVMMQAPSSGAGAVMGALAGGAMGNAVGNGGGRALATVIGIVGGAMVGDRIEGGGQPQLQNLQSCSTQTFYENRLNGYNVVYEYAGKQYTVQMPNDPGPTVQLQILPVGSLPPPPAQPLYAPPQMTAPVGYVAPAAVYTTDYGYYAQPYYARPSYAPVGVSLNFGYHGGSHGRHWR